MSSIAPKRAPKAAQEQKETENPAPPQDGFEQGTRPNPGRKLIPAVLALGGAAAGIVGGFTGGVAGGVGGAIALGAAGASASTVAAAFEEFGGTKPDYGKRAAIGGALGATAGALIGALSQSGGVALGMAIAGTIGLTLGYSFMQD